LAPPQKRRPRGLIPCTASVHIGRQDNQSIAKITTTTDRHPSRPCPFTVPGRALQPVTPITGFSVSQPILLYAPLDDSGPSITLLRAMTAFSTPCRCNTSISHSLTTCHGSSSLLHALGPRWLPSPRPRPPALRHAVHFTELVDVHILGRQRQLHLHNNRGSRHQ